VGDDGKSVGGPHASSERGFIRAEVYTIPDLEEYKNEGLMKAARKMRLEGKEYTVADGDVMHFRFNV
jgi:ribosome-binding ATPase YchF (GTP1/OBG family)